MTIVCFEWHTRDRPGAWAPLQMQQQTCVSIPYTRVRTVITEIFRVTRPYGTVWMSLHGIEMERYFTWSVIRRRKVKDLIKRAYVWVNGCYFALAGDTFYRPSSTVMESFQFKGAMRRAMRRAGFVNIQFDKDGYKLLVQARRPPERFQARIRQDAPPR